MTGQELAIEVAAYSLQKSEEDVVYFLSLLPLGDLFSLASLPRERYTGRIKRIIELANAQAFREAWAIGEPEKSILA
jgi:hypothetical protein